MDERSDHVGVSRRGLLVGVGALSLGTLLPAYVHSTLTLDRFMTISARLCDTPLYSRTFGADILALLSHEFSAVQLSTLADFVEGHADKELDFDAVGQKRIVSRLVAVWYSGVAPMRNGGERVLPYADAAAWAATGYAKPPSYCATFGEWAQAPELSSPRK
jgi:Membrane bound FAD containing D-sorbitol dehydrogenase